MTLALQQMYSLQYAETMWEAFRVWLNGDMFGLGVRFSPNSANAIMLISALLFIFMLELLLTVGIQIWERRLLARMQQRRGPQEYGGITPRAFRMVFWPIAGLLGLPALLYALQYRSQHSYYINQTYALAAFFMLLLAIGYLLNSADRKIRLPMRLRSPLQQFLGAQAHLSRLLKWPLIAALAATLFVALSEGRIQPLDMGGFIANLTVICSALAFIYYLVYMFGWYWRQGLYDAVKLFFKEDIVPLNADRFLFMAAPLLVYIPALLSWIVIPFGVAVINGKYVYMVVKDLNVGLLLIIADFAMFLVAVIMSGYASNNKYALIGAMREAALLLTYEVPMLMSLLCVALFAGSLNLTTIVQHQSMTWAVLPLFPAFVILLVASLAETNRPPFDLPEASNELLGGYVVEYSGLRFALFYIAEYSNVFIVSAEIAICFLGGWKGPMFLGFEGLWLTSMFWFLLKVYGLVFFFIWARATMPRIRVDQIMFFSWKFLLPASVVVLVFTGLGVLYRHPWFNSNHIWNRALFDYELMTTAEALKVMTVHERAFFWSYNVFMVALGLFILVLAWRILFSGPLKHPLPRRALTWH